MFTPRIALLESLQETISFVPDENLPLLNEAALLLSELLPPWDNKAAYITPVENALSGAHQFGKIVEDHFYSAEDILKNNID